MLASLHLLAMFVADLFKPLALLEPFVFAPVDRASGPWSRGTDLLFCSTASR